LRKTKVAKNIPKGWIDKATRLKDTKKRRRKNYSKLFPALTHLSSLTKTLL